MNQKELTEREQEIVEIAKKINACFLEFFKVVSEIDTELQKISDEMGDYTAEEISAVEDTKEVVEMIENYIKFESLLF